MRALAEFTMRGRTQALLVTAISAGTLLFFWIGAAILALVTLRKGVSEGLIILLWAVLPAVAVLWFGGDVAPLAALVAVWVAASVLRLTVAWPWALIAVVACALMLGAILLWLAPGYLDQLHNMLAQFVQHVRKDLPPGKASVPMAVPSVVQLAGMLAFMNAVSVFFCLVLGRWCQAMLYNPGGFREEFHRLRLPRVIAVGLLAVVAASLTQGVDGAFWAWTCSVPLVVAGAALVHGMVGLRKLGRGWLVAFYALLVLFNPVKELLALAAVADSFTDFRGRTKAPNG